MFGMTYDGFVVICAGGTDTNDHPDFPLPLEMVLEEMGELRVSVWDNLN